MATGAAAILSALDAALRYDPFYAAVTVTSVGPDDVAVLATAANVDAVWRGRRQAEGDLGGLSAGSGSLRWRLRASQVGFVPKVGDHITEADGAVWVIDAVEVAVRQQRYVCETTRARS